MLTDVVIQNNIFVCQSFYFFGFWLKSLKREILKESIVILNY